MPELFGVPVSILTASGLLGLTVLFIIMGKLVPKVFYDGAKAESEKWRLAYEAERAARFISDAQTAELLTQAKVTHSVVVSMFGLLEKGSQTGGGPDVVPLAR